MSSFVNLPCSNAAEMSGPATSIRPMVAGTATKTVPHIPFEMVACRALKSFLAASVLITGNMAVARDIPRTPNGS